MTPPQRMPDAEFERVTKTDRWPVAVRAIITEARRAREAADVAEKRVRELEVDADTVDRVLVSHGHLPSVMNLAGRVGMALDRERAKGEAAARATIGEDVEIDGRLDVRAIEERERLQERVRDVERERDEAIGARDEAVNDREGLRDLRLEHETEIAALRTELAPLRRVVEAAQAWVDDVGVCHFCTMKNEMGEHGDDCPMQWIPTPSRTPQPPPVSPGPAPPVSKPVATEGRCVWICNGDKRKRCRLPYHSAITAHETEAGGMAGGWSPLADDSTIIERWTPKKPCRCGAPGTRSKTDWCASCGLGWTEVGQEATEKPPLAAVARDPAVCHVCFEEEGDEHNPDCPRDLRFKADCAPGYVQSIKVTTAPPPNPPSIRSQVGRRRVPATATRREWTSPSTALKNWPSS